MNVNSVVACLILLLAKTLVILEVHALPETLGDVSFFDER